MNTLVQLLVEALAELPCPACHTPHGACGREAEVARQGCRHCEPTRALLDSVKEDRP